jgi:hypothetical protein
MKIIAKNCVKILNIQTLVEISDTKRVKQIY